MLVISNLSKEGEGLTAVIIDNGVDCGYYPGIDKLVFDLFVNQRNKVVKCKGKLGNSHGTICAAYNSAGI